MSLLYDLHTHSTASDGTLSPTQLVQRALSNKVQVLALTDHDTLAGIPEAKREAERSGICLIAGVEISITWNRRTIHVLGLGVDPENEHLNTGLAKLRDFRDWRAREIGRRLDKAGIPGTFEGASKLSQGAIISRTHFAQFLVQRGKAATVRDVFKKYLVSGRPGHVPGKWVELDVGVQWILAAGGQAVIAHPARYNLSATKMRQLLSEFKECGGVGIEVVSGSHSPSEQQAIAQQAQQHGLLASSGSDFHGPENPWVELGRMAQLPSQCVPIWAHWHHPSDKVAQVCST